MFSWFGLDLPLPERLGLIKGAGFDASTLWWGGEEQALREAPAMVRDAGLHLENVHVPYDLCSDIWSQSATTRAHVESRYLRWIDDCHAYAIPIMVTHISRGSAAEGPTLEGIQLIGALLERAEAARVIIALENTRRADYLEAIFRDLDSPALGFCLDSSHNWLWTRDAHLLRDFGARLVTTHMSDTRGALDRHWLPGKGELDWDALARDFPQGYRGRITLEVVPERRTEADPRIFVQDAFQQALWVRKRLLTAAGA